MLDWAEKAAQWIGGAVTFLGRMKRAEERLSIVEAAVRRNPPRPTVLRNRVVWAKAVPGSVHANDALCPYCAAHGRESPLTWRESADGAVLEIGVICRDASHGPKGTQFYLQRKQFLKDLKDTSLCDGLG